MKNYMIVFALFLGIQTIQAQDSAQTPAPQNESATISDEELKKYAITRDSIDDMKETLMKDLTAMVQNGKIKVARYNELSKIIGNEAELAKANATPEEIAFVKEVAAKREEGTAKIQTMLQTMAKDYVGTTSYNKIKKALTTDPDVKKRYEAQLNEIDGEGGGN